LPVVLLTRLAEAVLLPSWQPMHTADSSSLLEEGGPATVFSPHPERLVSDNKLPASTRI